MQENKRIPFISIHGGCSYMRIGPGAEVTTS